MTMIPARMPFGQGSYKDDLEAKQAELAKIKAHNDYLEQMREYEQAIKAEKKRSRKFSFFGRIMNR